MNKKSIFTGLRSFLLLWSSQAVSELGTAMTNFALYSFSALQVWHLYIINVVLSLMNAFQSPAAYVATSLLVPKEQYTRVSGLQAFSGSIVTILAPALGSSMLAFGGMKTVLVFDLVSFAVAFFTLLFLVKIPVMEHETKEDEGSFLKDCLVGIDYLRDHTALLHLILFFTIINFLAKIGDDGMMSPFILGRTGNDQKALGMAEASVALGILTGSLIVTFMKPVKKKVKLIFISCAIIFSGNVILSLTHTVSAWCIAVFASYATAAVMNANLTTVMRIHVPLEMQQTLSIFFGSGNGAGIAGLFFGVGILGSVISLTRLRKPIYKILDREDQSCEPGHQQTELKK